MSINHLLINCTIQRIGSIILLKSGEYKREIDVSWGNQNFRLDEMVEDPESVYPIDSTKRYHFDVYINGIKTPRGNVNHMLIQHIHPDSGRYITSVSNSNQNQ